jgi:hypothetical protein
VFRKGGDIVSLIPHKASLEDIFVEEVKKEMGQTGGGGARL